MEKANIFEEKGQPIANLQISEKKRLFTQCNEFSLWKKQIYSRKKVNQLLTFKYLKKRDSFPTLYWFRCRLVHKLAIFSYFTLYILFGWQWHQIRKNSYFLRFLVGRVHLNCLFLIIWLFNCKIGLFRCTQALIPCAEFGKNHNPGSNKILKKEELHHVTFCTSPIYVRLFSVGAQNN